MQGTVVMLMALSGLGCHNKSCDAVYAPPTYGCFGGGCYANVYPNYVAPSCYSGCYTGGYSGCYATAYGSGFGGGCYGGCYSSCYSSCYGAVYSGGHHGCGLLSRLFGCCGHRKHSYYAYDDFGYSSFGGGYGYGAPYSPPIFGYALQFNYGETPPGDMTTGAAMPSEAATPVPANPVPSTTPPPPPAPSEPNSGVTPVTPPTPANPVAPDPTVPVTPPRPTPADIPVPTPPKPST